MRMSDDDLRRLIADSFDWTPEDWEQHGYNLPGLLHLAQRGAELELEEREQAWLLKVVEAWRGSLEPYDEVRLYRRDDYVVARVEQDGDRWSVEAPARLADTKDDVELAELVDELREAERERGADLAERRLQAERERVLGGMSAEELLAHVELHGVTS